MTLEPVLAATPWRNNAELIADCARLGYLRDEWLTLDPTYGQGAFWTLWRPNKLITHDLKHDGVDFRELPYDDGYFGAVVFDPPYKLNGTPTVAVDARYGVDVVNTIEQRHELIREGIDECVRVLAPKGYLLIKCMDQVSSGKVQWQTRIFVDHAERAGQTRLVDSLLMLGGRRQPEGRSQQHARRNYSTLLVLRRSPPRKRL